MSLFLKYRPQTFSDLVGQENTRQTLQNALKSSQPAHAYLFCGSRGTGKTSTARIFAKGLNCTNLQNGDPCGECEMCRETADGALVDVVEIDAASNRGIDEIRDLRQKIGFAPTIAKRKVYIIDEVHMLTKEAFNALLKTLEEPPDHAFFCLATTEKHKVPETILSRCQTFLFRKFTLDELRDRLQYICQNEGILAEDEALNMIGKHASGGLRDAISLLEQLAIENNQNLTTEKVQASLGIIGGQDVRAFLDQLQNLDTEGSLKSITNITESGQDLRAFGHECLSQLRTDLHQAVKNNTSASTIIQSINHIEQALQRLKTSPIPSLAFEIAAIEICKQAPQAVAPVQATKVSASTPAAAPHANAPVKTETATAKKDPSTKPAFEVNITSTAEKSTPAVKKEAPIESQASDKPASNDLLQKIQTEQKNIAEKAGLPAFVKKSFTSCVPTLESGVIVFETDSDFHREKLAPLTTQVAIKKAISELTGQTVDIEIRKSDQLAQKKAQLTPTPNQKNSTGPSPEASADDFLVF